MPPYTIEQIRNEVSRASEEYNATAPLGEKIASVSLFGSYADGRATRRSDIDLLVRFTSAVYPGPGAVLHGGALGRLGGRGARPRPR